MVLPMLLAGLFAFTLFLVCVVADWMYFSSLSPSADRYGCGIAAEEHRLPVASQGLALDRFDSNGFLALPHGVARWNREDNRIVLRPQYRFFSLRFRTAWPIKGTVDLKQDGESTRLRCVKRIPWSSALITLMWFAIVGFGTLGFVIVYALEGGLSSLGSILVGLGITAVGVFVLVFGLITISLAYKLENARLGLVSTELRDALSGSVQWSPTA